MAAKQPSLIILGTRGIPAAHGGFETFAEKLALFLVRRGWHVAVYCQDDVSTVTERFRTTTWQGVEQIHVAVSSTGPKATLEFDWHCVRDAARRDSVSLVLGDNGAVFLPYLRLAGRKILTNMDGIEWKRPKWSFPVRAWFWVNEWIAAWASHRLVADHPAIADHVATRRPRSAIATIPYGGDPIAAAPTAPIAAMGLQPGRYMTSIARVEPDNNILAMVQAFSRKARGMRLVVLGNLSPDNPYHRAVRDAASAEVLFPGAIYEAETIQSLRFHARAYLHGHTVGGTNPSLVEALWAGNAVIAHDNPFNRGTAGAEQFYFSDVESCERLITHLAASDIAVRNAGRAALARAAERFEWSTILTRYEDEALALGGYQEAVADSAAEPAVVASQGLRSGHTAW